MQRYVNSILVNTQAGLRPITNASVQVYLHGTTTPAALFEDNGVTPKPNPFNSEFTGEVDFYAANGRYDILVRHSQHPDVWVLDVLLYDPSGIAGSVTSVAMSVPTGMTIDGSPITTSGTLVVGYASGYSLPTNAKQGEWDQAYGWGNHADAGYALASSLGSLAYEDKVGVADIDATGTPDGTKALFGDGTWKVPSGGGGGIPDAPNDGGLYGRQNEDWTELGSAATASTGDFATAAQGGLADTAIQPEDLGSAAYQNTSAFATATQGGKADTAVQPGTLAAVATSGDYGDLLNKPTIPTSPGGDFVGTTATQTLTNKTLGTGSKESVTTDATITINDAAAPFQQITLAANATAAINLSVGVSRTIWLNPGTYTVTWPSGTILVNLDSLPASKWSLITLTGMPSNTAGVAALVASQP